ncbi:major facilitator superfamily domain-containing protein [Bombardia bombarda]|uniref:Major facilitator superfamily domain-containing protein n=1 Tax=Bombardia bombarda TaxID=252184 RepID=A0AA40C5U9_9PEZI|nr:major facilitator superfamily domain-containing protein [Bombardia bombarda]
MAVSNSTHLEQGLKMEATATATERETTTARGSSISSSSKGGFAATDNSTSTSTSTLPKAPAAAALPQVPQPSTSPDDPLNWSWAKKHAVLLALIPGCMLSDWTLTWGTTVFQLQAPEWSMTIEAVSQSVSPGIFMQGPGGLLSVPLCQRYGRLPVLFWSQLLSLAFTIGATFAPGYASFTAMRTLQGFCGAAPQVMGMSMIHDMFFFDERARKVNIWAASFLLGPYLGPFISSLLLQRIGWRADFAVLAGFYGVSVAMVVVLGDETLFEREGMGQVDGAGRRKPSVLRHVRLLLGIEGWRKTRNSRNRPTMWTTFKQQLTLLSLPHLLLPTALFVMPITMWTIGLVSTISQFVLPPPEAGGFGFSLVGLAMLYFAPMLGTLLAEAWGHWFNDLLARRHMARYGLECRLTACYPAVLLGAVGLVVIGQTIEKQLSWVGLAFGWAMVCFMTLASMTAISAYLLDCLPEQAALTGAWLNSWRVVGGFSVVYFQMQWVGRSGPAVSFGCQAVVVVGAAAAVAATQLLEHQSATEWSQGIQFLTAVGQTCTDVRREFILLSDVLGLSLLVDPIDHPKPAASAEGTVLGPFHCPGHGIRDISG